MIPRDAVLLAAAYLSLPSDLCESSWPRLEERHISLSRSRWLYWTWVQSTQISQGRCFPMHLKGNFRNTFRSWSPNKITLRCRLFRILLTILRFRKHHRYFFVPEVHRARQESFEVCDQSDIFVERCFFGRESFDRGPFSKRGGRRPCACLWDLKSK